MDGLTARRLCDAEPVPREGRVAVVVDGNFGVAVVPVVDRVVPVTAAPFRSGLFSGAFLSSR